MTNIDKIRTELEHKLESKFMDILEKSGKSRMLVRNRNLQTSKAIVIDVGQFSTKMGYAGEDKPQLIERTAIVKDFNGQIICGEDAIAKGNYEVPLKYSKIVEYDKW